MHNRTIGGPLAAEKKLRHNKKPFLHETVFLSDGHNKTGRGGILLKE